MPGNSCNGTIQIYRKRGKKRKAAFAIWLVFIVLCYLAVPVFASEPFTESRLVLKETTERYLYSEICRCHYTVLPSGEAEVRIAYATVNEGFIQVKASLKIQKRFLGLFWKTVSEWEETSCAQRDTFYRTVPLDDKGTYRLVGEVVFSGTAGDAELIEIEKS